MFKNYLRNLFGKLFWKFLKLAVILIIALVTWELVVKEKNASKGKKVYEESRQLYRELKGYDNTPHYEMRSDSFCIYVIEK